MTRRSHPAGTLVRATRHSVCALLCLCLLSTAAADTTQPSLRQAAGGRLAHVFERGQLIVGVKTDYPPWGMIDGQGQIVGFGPDLAHDLGQRLGLPVKLIPVTSDNRLRRLQQGQVDVVIATLGDTANRRAAADLLLPHYYASGVRLLARDDFPFGSWGELRGRSICLTEGAYFNRELAARFLIDPLVFSGTRDARMALQDGRCVGWAYDNTILMRLLNQPGWADYQLALPPIFQVRWAIAVRQGEATRTLGRFITAAIVDWHRSGLLQQLQRKWSLPPSPFLQAQQQHWIGFLTANPQCRAQANGLFPTSCFTRTKGSARPDSTHVPDWAARLQAHTGLDLTPLFNAFNRMRLLTGIWLTFAISAVSIIGSLLFGIVLAVVELRCQYGLTSWLLRAPSRGFLALARMTPPLLQLYIIYFGISSLLAQYLGITLSSFVVASIVFSAYAGASNAAILAPALKRQRRQQPTAALPAIIGAAIEQSFESLVSILVNIVKAAALASTIALPGVISAITALISEGGDAPTLMTLLLLFYFCFVLAVMGALNLLKSRVLK